MMSIIQKAYKDHNGRAWPIDGHIYVLQMTNPPKHLRNRWITDDYIFCKVGRTNNLERRMGEYKTELSWVCELELLHSFPTNDAKTAEREILDGLGNSVRGEWFWLDKYQLNGLMLDFFTVQSFKKVQGRCVQINKGPIKENND